MIAEKRKLRKEAFSAVQRRRELVEALHADVERQNINLARALIEAYSAGFEEGVNRVISVAEKELEELNYIG